MQNSINYLFLTLFMSLIVPLDSFGPFSLIKIIFILYTHNFNLFHAATQDYNIRKSPCCSAGLGFHHIPPLFCLPLFLAPLRQANGLRGPATHVLHGLTREYCLISIFFSTSGACTGIQPHCNKPLSHNTQDNREPE